jgi:hypothetical protein
MILIVCGSRTLAPPPSAIDGAGDGLLFVLDDVTEVWHGGASGADMTGDAWARERGLPVRVFRPDYQKASGYYAPKLRNAAMVIEASSGRKSARCIALWDGLSGGTADTIARCASTDIPVRVVRLKPQEHPCDRAKVAPNWGTSGWFLEHKGRKRP